ncbi:hypothetical protein B0T16DRAFT_226845 [Cercophora newfieldiana]|uniref:Uncharacterized protein n=1 Tax=Cercophora newfieldiana TaxID=92897 RepID=A0AA39XQV8_9PEZI|nr:hypothetical protein B0T16DRAFT_226845 [Cercophora newfieldiana]
MGLHQDDDEPVDMADYYSSLSDCFPGGHPSSTGFAPFPGSVPSHGFQQFNNVFRYDAGHGGSQYHNGSQTTSSGFSSLSSRTKNSALATKRRHGQVLGSPRMDYTSGSTQDRELPMASDIPGISGIPQMPEHGSVYHSTAAPAPDPFDKGLGTRNDTFPWLYDTSLSTAAMDATLSPFADGDIDGGFRTGDEHSAPTRRRLVHLNGPRWILDLNATNQCDFAILSDHRSASHHICLQHQHHRAMRDRLPSTITIATQHILSDCLPARSTSTTQGDTTGGPAAVLASVISAG